MKKLVRGGIILSIISLFVVLVYAQSATEEILDIAEVSQNQEKDTVIESNKATVNKETQDHNSNKVTVKQETQTNNSNKATVKPELQDSNTNKLVEKTVMSRAATRAISRGSFTATAYCLKGRTAMGHSVRKGIIAADPRVLKLGSKVRLGAGAYSGEYLVSDTGGRIKGNKIDIWVPNCSEARRFGRRTVQIEMAQ